MLRHLELAAHYDGETRAATRMRQHISWYGKSMGHVKPLKEAIRTAPDLATMVRALEDARDRFGALDAPAIPASRTALGGSAWAESDDFSKRICP